jgi:hypothetical protein
MFVYFVNQPSSNKIDLNEATHFIIHALRVAHCKVIHLSLTALQPLTYLERLASNKYPDLFSLSVSDKANEFFK